MWHVLCKQDGGAKKKLAGEEFIQRKMGEDGGR